VSQDKFHDETGYWMWGVVTQTVMNSVMIPRDVCILAGGKYCESSDMNGQRHFSVKASLKSDMWSIVQSPFMLEKAKTTFLSFSICGEWKDETQSNNDARYLW